MEEITVKKMYEILKNEKMKEPTIKQKNPAHNYENILKNISMNLFPPKINEFLFLYTHDILPTKQRLKRCKYIMKR